MRNLRLFFATFCVCSFYAFFIGHASATSPKPYAPQEGDVLFQPLPLNELAAAIEGVTQSRLSHCGAVVSENGSWQVIEATSGGVRQTPLALWLVRGRKGSVIAMRPDARYAGKIPEFIAAMKSYIGKPYDYRYQMSDDAIYCSELVYKGFKTATGEEMGRLQKLGDMNWRPHARFIVQMEGGPVPKEREMITPIGLSKAPQLKEVYRSGTELDPVVDETVATPAAR
ncbi:hypothetical protein DB346_20640 [Verrucomicrobia bacterium LW23]|nr:hypothetical protein DB346_20640 [Verrucomicrobia bacterium LW23]